MAESIKRKHYKRNWIKANTMKFEGFRVIRPVFLNTTECDAGRLMQMEVTPDMFMFGPSTKKPYRIWGTNTEVYLPRALCTRARIVVNKNTNEIIATSKKYSANKT